MVVVRLHGRVTPSGELFPFTSNFQQLLTPVLEPLDRTSSSHAQDELRSPSHFRSAASPAHALTASSAFRIPAAASAFAFPSSSSAGSLSSLPGSVSTTAVSVSLLSPISPTAGTACLQRAAGGCLLTRLIRRSLLPHRLETATFTLRLSPFPSLLYTWKRQRRLPLSRFRVLQGQEGAWKGWAGWKEERRGAEVVDGAMCFVIVSEDSRRVWSLCGCQGREADWESLLTALRYLTQQQRAQSLYST